MIAAVDLEAYWFMVAAVIGLTVTAIYHLLVGRRTVRQVTQLRRRQLDQIIARDRCNPNKPNQKESNHEN